MSDQKINIIFVGEVEKHEVINCRNIQEKTTEKAWQEVADKVNMSAAECKEKWRNLRTVFMRKMKLPPSGSGANTTPHYLAEAMQFCLPFIKTIGPSSSGNLLPVPHEETTDAILENETRGNDDIASMENSSDIFQSTQVPPTPPSSTPPESSQTLPPHSTYHPVQSTSIRAKRNLTLRNKSAADADKCVAEYFKAKKIRLENTANETANTSHTSDRKETLKMFLLSLIPELEELTDYQIKTFKRQVFTLIDDISTPREPYYLATPIDILLSPHSVSSHTSGTSYTYDSSNKTTVCPVLQPIQVQTSPSPTISVSPSTNSATNKF